MSLSELVVRLGLGNLHALFAQQIGPIPNCLPIIQDQMHLDDMSMAWIVDDFIRLGLVMRLPDPNFIVLDSERILAMVDRLLLSMTGEGDTYHFLMSVNMLSLCSSSFEIPQARLHSPPKAEEPSQYPSFRLSRSGWQGGKTTHRHR